ncbi:MAG TPA: carboxypeptidase regulatory-like domain-containing protein [Fimbriiglobus sp.]|jgi:plastocyanin|nr:carboxypeptidase regulatory-like domain-containing protein [Fimbriiglobus sp.]
MKRSTVWGVAALTAAAGLLAAVGCGDQPAADTSKSASATQTQQTPPTEKSAAVTPATPPKTTTAPPVDVKPAAGTASIVGKVVYNGEPPKRKPINFGPEKKCHEHHSSPPMEETLVVGADRGIQWTLVRIAGKVAGNYPPSAKPAVLDQKGCVFSPHILPVMTGQEVEIRNSDPVLHNVRLEATLNPPFNRNLPKPGDAMTVKFTAAEVGLKIKCDVHFWMGGYIHVLPHPFFGVTGEDGAFTIDKVPPGTHKLEAWHEKLGKQTQEVTVKDGEVKTVEFVFQPK